MTQRRRPIIGALCVLTLGLATVAAAQTRGSIAGTVTLKNGTVLARVVLVVRGSEPDDERTTVTDADGAFSVGGLPAGDYVVSLTDTGFKPFSRKVTVAAGQVVTLAVTLEYSVLDFVAVKDRWQLPFPLWQRYASDKDGEYPFVSNRGFNPYQQSKLKGDLPIAGTDVFMVLSAALEVPVEFHRLPTPSGVSTAEPAGEAFFGHGEQLALLPTGIGSFELFKGSTAFKPRDWALRVTPQFNLNVVHTKEQSVINASPEEGTDRTRHHVALQEAFGEKKLFDVGPNYDFVSVRGGIQPFNSDFRGFLYRDSSLGVRAFGTMGRNRSQWNVAYFDQLEKETNSELNLLERRHQTVFLGNYYRQDFLTQGYTVSPSFAMNTDKGEELFFDENGFLVRPSPVGLIVPHEVRAYYVGFGGDGHIGRLNVTHQFYQAFGQDDFNGISGQHTDINAQFAAAEVSVDRDWLRPRVGVVFASGDDDPDDGKARGFDAIVDDPNILGGPFSFWSRSGLRLAQTGLSLKGRNSVLTSLRSSKSEGQANFVNPGVLIFGGGLDAQVTTKMRTTFTVNYVQLQQVAVLQRLLFQSDIRKSLGLDIGGGVQYRPVLNDNVTITAGSAVFRPAKGFAQLLEDRTLYSVFAVLTLAY